MTVTIEQAGLFGQAIPVPLPSRKRRKPSHSSPVTCQLQPGEVLTWSYGGGTQSVAMALLIALGKLPKPDLIVMADTGSESSETWEYTFRYVLPLLDSLGLTIELASHDLATVDLYAHNGDLLIPAYTQTGKLPTFCSSEWKKQVFRRYVRAKGIDRCVTWFGMSTDELERVKPSDVQWQRYHWPLVFDVPMTRIACQQLILNYGWPRAPKSACIHCPHCRNDQWLRRKQYYPQDFARACALDEYIREHDAFHAVYLHESRLPLSQVDFTQPDSPTLFGDENGGCQSGYCMY